MSESMMEENQETDPDSLMMSLDSQADSGYLTFLSSCPASPAQSYLTDSQFESPTSELDSPSFNRQSFCMATDYRITRKHIDIFSQLVARNAYHLLDTIFNHLSDKDLFHCLNVSQQWKRIVTEYQQRRQRHHVKRNLFELDQNDSPKRYKKMANAPLQLIVNQVESNVVKMEEILTMPATGSYNYLKYLHGPNVPKRCPICTLVAVVDINDQHGYVGRH
jgi:hypothetical protein